MIETEQSKVPRDRRRSYSEFISVPDDILKLMEKFEEVDKKFVQEVNAYYDRIIACCSDMPSAEIKYHRDLLVFSSIWF